MWKAAIAIVGWRGEGTISHESLLHLPRFETYFSNNDICRVQAPKISFYRFLPHLWKLFYCASKRSQGGKEGDRSMFSAYVVRSIGVNSPKNGPVPGRPVNAYIARLGSARTRKRREATLLADWPRGSISPAKKVASHR